MPNPAASSTLGIGADSTCAQCTRMHTNAANSNASNKSPVARPTLIAARRASPREPSSSPAAHATPHAPVKGKTSAEWLHDVAMAQLEESEDTNASDAD